MGVLALPPPEEFHKLREKGAGIIRQFEDRGTLQWYTRALVSVIRRPAWDRQGLKTACKAVAAEAGPGPHSGPLTRGSKSGR